MLEKKPLNDEFDAAVWAREFCETNRASDEDTMRAWFANAIMAGYDHAFRKIHENMCELCRQKNN